VPIFDWTIFTHAQFGGGVYFLVQQMDFVMRGFIEFWLRQNLISLRLCASLCVKNWVNRWIASSTGTSSGFVGKIL
jgi:hypothetical protein